MIIFPLHVVNNEHTSPFCLNFATFKNEKIKKERIERYEKINVDSS
jgi:hypothetical protein